MQALVSIVLPIYNSDLFLQKAIESLLNQTHRNIEIICLNDGSTDTSLQILQSFTDQRIKIIHQPSNKGIVYNLNEGIQLANGEFIARMDADDIALPMRIEKQVEFLIQHPKTFMVATTVQLMNEQDEKINNWDLDWKTIDDKFIRKTMFSESCIAHPSVMFRKEIKHYSYQENQQHCEDYGLWLELLSDRKVISKINEPLLLYRVHSNSITLQFLRKSNPFLKLWNCKRRFLWMQIKKAKWSMFETKLLLYMKIDFIKAIAKEIKNLIN